MSQACPHLLYWKFTIWSGKTPELSTDKLLFTAAFITVTSESPSSMHPRFSNTVDTTDIDTSQTAFIVPFLLYLCSRKVVNLIQVFSIGS